MKDQCKFKIGDLVYNYNGPFDEEVTLVVQETNKFNKICVIDPETLQRVWYKEDYFELRG